MTKTVSDQKSGATKLGSIQAIRGFAALFVALGHLYYAFFSNGDMITAVGRDAAEGVMHVTNNMPKFWKLVPRSSVWVDVFFLISGFVIEISLAKVKGFAFLLQRSFRIYSVFWVACICHIIANTLVFQTGLPSGWGSNLFLINNSLLSPVSWTLIIEMHFYAIVALLSIFGVSPMLRIIIINLTFFSFYVLSERNILPWQFHGFIGEFFYFCWMSLGAALYLVYRDRLTSDTSSQGITHLKFLFGLMVTVYVEYQLTLHHAVGSTLFKDMDTISLLAAYGIFVTSIFLWPNYSSNLTNFLGDISYPLYCLHFPLGWMLHYLFVGILKCSPFLSLVIVLPILCFVSYLVHVLIENPANQIGKRLSHKLS